ncbi:hypothetical protein ASPACDRAFT_45787 [Aspergillus aculeatus ATCC 16872]|uniref:Zn(2)-C6 fungal-type domain-containing protein n=1 Tax=Aspergillus aculeatus (strain ATCC 16872 / CBS 172.66 / WB 5094) TaxID=690307 RepID=A0A1L9WNI4_ASPA1|nr:uncharacterized protein ASPACDRAFT_45787 [Aspergillus aculeatus ATCC 16872]OJJ97690.1 hypothetical protein ASPACDRAFT_45787 [Aspergillus aculeatus ATCC 16872]
MSDSNPSLRASCERCRAHKLRCVPSIAGDPTGPCQRCAKAKIPRSCTYSRRLKTGRNKLRGGDEDPPEAQPQSQSQSQSHSRKLTRTEREVLTQPPLPGMGTFVLPPSSLSSSAPSSSSCSSSLSSLPSPLECPALPLEATEKKDGNLFADTDAMIVGSFPWGDKTSAALIDPPDLLINTQHFSAHHLSGLDEGLEASTGSATDEYIAGLSMYTDWDRVLLSFAQGDALMNDSMEGGRSIPTTTATATTATKKMVAATTAGPSPAEDHFTTLTGLLAKMSHYEAQISQSSRASSASVSQDHQKHGGGDALDNYPIGDALFLSRGFYKVVSAHRGTEGGEAEDEPNRFAASATEPLSWTSAFDIPTKLLTLSCYLVLTRIYTAIFTDLYDQLSQLSAMHCSSHPTRQPSLDPFLEDADMYLGLRLGELQPTCGCVDTPVRETATRARKAVAILLGSLEETEAALELPDGVSILANHKGVTRESGMERSMVHAWEENGAGVSPQGAIMGLTNEHLYQTMRKQGSHLRSKIDEVEHLLRELLNMY